MSTPSIRARVEAGVAWLDDHAPANWRARIDLSQFDVRSGYLCVLGQIFEELARDNGVSNGYSYVFSTRFEYVNLQWVIDHGFETNGFSDAAYDLLEAAWRAHLNDHDPARRAWHTYLSTPC